jgi:hypothetical protein
MSAQMDQFGHSSEGRAADEIPAVSAAADVSRNGADPVRSTPLVR